MPIILELLWMFSWRQPQQSSSDIRITYPLITTPLSYHFVISNDYYTQIIFHILKLEMNNLTSVINAHLSYHCTLMWNTSTRNACQNISGVRLGSRAEGES